MDNMRSFSSCLAYFGDNQSACESSSTQLCPPIRTFKKAHDYPGRVIARSPVAFKEKAYRNDMISERKRDESLYAEEFMHVIGTIETVDTPVALTARRFLNDGSTREQASEIQSESLLTVNVNDIPTMQIGCSADHLVELVCGRLITEGLVSNLDEIDTLSICENSLTADVYLHDREADLSRRAAHMVPTCCTNNVTLNDYFDAGEPLLSVKPIPWDAEWIFQIIEAFEQDLTLHRRTRGTHSAYLANREGILLFREDIGRHNALDKVVGSALIEGIDLSQCLLFTSGRVPTDMTTKVVRAGIPILASKSAATDKTIQMAREYNLTLICNANQECFDVFHDPAANLQ